ncbi:MAG: hypothetical protein ACKVUT_17515 [Gaiella sp.]
MRALRISALALVPALFALAGLGTGRLVSAVALVVVLGIALAVLPQPSVPSGSQS